MTKRPLPSIECCVGLWENSPEWHVQIHGFDVMAVRGVKTMNLYGQRDRCALLNQRRLYRSFELQIEINEAGGGLAIYPPVDARPVGNPPSLANWPFAVHSVTGEQEPRRLGKCVGANQRYGLNYQGPPIPVQNTNDARADFPGGAYELHRRGTITKHKCRLSALFRKLVVHEVRANRRRGKAYPSRCGGHPFLQSALVLFTDVRTPITWHIGDRLHQQNHRRQGKHRHNRNVKSFVEHELSPAPQLTLSATVTGLNDRGWD